jgi:hypothetical protein
LTYITNVAAQVVNDRCVIFHKLAQAHGMSIRPFTPLSTKLARWVPKLLNQEMKNKRVRICEAFMALVYRHSLVMLDRIVTVH